MRSGLDITIIGAPNSGKSSIINYLADRDAAIISDIAGTTRDIIDVQLNLGGLPVRLSDTAGLRDTGDVIEAEGVRRAKVRAQESDIRVYVQDSTKAGWDMTALSKLSELDFVLVNKVDLGTLPVPPALKPDHYYVSAVTGENLEAFRDELERRVIEVFSPSQDAGLTRARHRDCVERANQALGYALTHLADAPELAGDDIRTALTALKELAGEVDIEAVFDRIFSRFCVGK